jgi:hypothetical protein
MGDEKIPFVHGLKIHLVLVQILPIRRRDDARQYLQAVRMQVIRLLMLETSVEY